MQDWHSTCLGRRTLPRDLSAFEIEAFFNFSDTEWRVIEDRRGPALKLALALQIGFLRMTGRLLEAARSGDRRFRASLERAQQFAVVIGTFGHSSPCACAGCPRRAAPPIPGNCHLILLQPTVRMNDL